jgi:hypothetical protein
MERNIRMQRFKLNKWIIVFILYTIILFAGLLITRFIIGSEVKGRYLFHLAAMSLGSAILPSIGGYLGKRVFFLLSSLADLIGLLYAFYVALGNVAPGWGDLTSIIGYLFIVILGAVIALIIEVIINVVAIKRKNNRVK